MIKIEQGARVYAIEQEVERFLASSTPEVLCITGSWGVGKTYAWGAYFRKSRQSGRVALKLYSNNSMFGLSSVESLKHSVFENLVDAKFAEKSINSMNLVQNADSAAKAYAKKVLPLLKLVPKANAIESALSSALPGLMVRNAIVVIDDIERKSKSLTIREIFGYVNNLKENNGCKVVIIINRDILQGDEAKEFDDLFEKTVDVNLEFKPSSETCAQIALGTDDIVSNRMRMDCVKLEISNIRVIKRIERLCRQVEPELMRFDKSILEQAIDTLVLLGYSHFSTDGPDISFLKRTRAYAAYGLDANNLTENETEWNNKIDAYGFRYMDEMDGILFDGVKRGYFDFSTLREKAKALDDQCRNNGARSKFSAAWRLYHDSFSDNQVEIIDMMINGLKEVVSTEHAANLNGTVSLLRELGMNDEANELVDYYAENHSDDPDAFDIQSMPFSSDITDEYIKTKFAEKAVKSPDIRTIGDVMKSLSDGSGWGERDVVFLDKTSIDEYYNLLKSYSGSDLDALIKNSLRIPNSQGDGRAAPNLEAALIKIAAESPLNHRRVAKYVKLPTPSERP